MLYGTKALSEEEYEDEIADLLIAFENSNYDPKKAIHIAGNVTIGYGLDLKTGPDSKDILGEYLPSDDKKLQIGKEKLTFYQIIQKYKNGDTNFTEPTNVKEYLQNSAFNFSLNKEEAKEVLKRTFKSYKDYIGSYINKNNLPSSKEKASLVSMHYHGRFFAQKENLRSAIIDNSRFLTWFIIRYKTNPRCFTAFFVRASDEAGIYMSYSKENQVRLILDIFSYLNIKKESIEFRDHEINTLRKKSKKLTKEDTIYNLISWYENELKFIKYEDKISATKLLKDARLKSKITNENIKLFKEIFSVFLNKLHELLKSHTSGTFDLKNIYVISLKSDGSHNVSRINKLLAEREENEEFKPQTKTNILIIYPFASPIPVKITQPKNTHLTIVLANNTSLDCSELNPEENSNDCEIILTDYQYAKKAVSDENINFINPSTKDIVTLYKQENNEYASSDNKYTYNASNMVTLNFFDDMSFNLLNFAKENNYSIRSDKASSMFDIKLKLLEGSNDVASTISEGNFNLVLPNLIMTDEYGNSCEASKLYLHNTEDKRTYKSFYLRKNSAEDAQFDNSYTAKFNINLNLDQDSNGFKKSSKFIIYSADLAQRCSTSVIHSMQDTATISVNKNDKQTNIKEGSVTLENKVSLVNPQNNITEIILQGKNFTLKDDIKLKAVYAPNKGDDGYKEVNWAYAVIDTNKYAAHIKSNGPKGTIGLDDEKFKGKEITFNPDKDIKDKNILD
ncbi:MAG: hypothetical protein LUC34_08225, partial [Campylobacter sp.]|nr:hypothetical protein [Campylobacter sp.]